MCSDRLAPFSHDIKLIEVVALHKLPVPPSVNGLYFNNGGGGRSITSAYRTWKNAAGWDVAAQHPARIRGPVALQYIFEDGSTKADLGNLEKAVTDLLVGMQLIDGDDPKTVRSIALAWGEVEGLNVEIRSLA